MATYAYYDGDKWIASTTAAIRSLAELGQVQPNTLIRFPDGSEHPAHKIKGLVFKNVSVPQSTKIPEPPKKKGRGKHAYFDGQQWHEGLSQNQINELLNDGTIKEGTLVRWPDGSETSISLEEKEESDYSQNPVTENQIDYLKKLGYTGPTYDLTAEEASELITWFTTVATPKQRAYLRYMGHKGALDLSMTNEEASALVEKYKERDKREGKQRFGNFDQILAEEESLRRRTQPRQERHVTNQVNVPVGNSGTGCLLLITAFASMAASIVVMVVI